MYDRVRRLLAYSMKTVCIFYSVADLLNKFFLSGHEYVMNIEYLFMNSPSPFYVLMRHG